MPLVYVAAIIVLRLAKILGFGVLSSLAAIALYTSVPSTARVRFVQCLTKVIFDLFKADHLKFRLPLRSGRFFIEIIL